MHNSMHKYHNFKEPGSPAFGKGPVGRWCGTISVTLKGEMTTEVAKQHALDRPMGHPTGGFLSEVWHGAPLWRRKHVERSYLGPQHRPCAISGAPDRSEAWSSAGAG